MSKQPSEAEWKTIRVLATSYYKLVELSGLMTFLAGEKFSMSTIADLAIAEYYDQYNKTYKDAITAPDKIAKVRENIKEFKENLERLSKSATKQKQAKHR